MKNKAIVIVLILILAVLSLTFVYSANSTGNANKTSLTVYSEGPIDLNVIIQDIKTKDSYKGYDNETLKWMESLGSKFVFPANGSFVVMSKEDAGKLTSEYVTDASIEEFIDCHVIENHSLGNVKHPKNIILVENVTYMGKEIHYLQGR